MASENKTGVSQETFDNMMQIYRHAEEYVAESELVKSNPRGYWYFPDDVDKADYQQSLQNFSRSVVIYENISSIVSSVFLIPNYWYAKINIQWDSLTDDNGDEAGELYRPMNEFVMIRDEMNYSDGTIRQNFNVFDNSMPIRATGKIDIEYPTQFDQHSFSCDEANKSTNLSGARFLLAHCKNSSVVIEQIGITENRVEIFILDEEGRLLPHKKSASLPLFEGGKKLDAFTASTLPHAVEGKASYYLVEGKIANIKIVTGTSFSNESLPIIAKRPIKLVDHGDAENVPNIRFAYHAKTLEPVTITVKEIKSEVSFSTSKSIYSGKENLTVLNIDIPEYFNTYHAKLELSHVHLTDSLGKKFPVKNRSISAREEYKYLLEPEDKSVNPLLLNHVSGELAIDYPVSMKFLFFPSAEKNGYSVTFKGGHLTVRYSTDLANNLIEFSSYLPTNVQPLHAYDKNGFALDSDILTGSERNDKEVTKHYSFSGEIEYVKIAIVVERKRFIIPIYLNIDRGSDGK